MKAKDDVYIRPLLTINKAAILSYLQAHEIPYLVDPSNVAESFLRNRIRLHVLPALQSCDERFDHNFLKTITNLQKIEQFLKKLAGHVYRECTYVENEAIALSITPFKELDETIQDRVLMQWLIDNAVSFEPSQGLLLEIKRFLLTDPAKSGIHHLYQKWSIRKKKGFATIHR
jgi:tRNA(Ile)-lysidine synthase TilS/MesJ